MKITRGRGKDVLEYRKGSGGTIEIYDIYVNSERRLGRGTALVEKLKKKVDTNLIFAFTRYENTKAHAFYEALGFERGPEIRRFYKDGDAVMYMLRL